MTTTEKKERLNELLSRFDWYWQRTEDSRVYNYWSKINDEIRSLRAELGDDGEHLFAQYHRRKFPDLY